jgi:ATP-dependent helicase/DNAse subunit B
MFINKISESKRNTFNQCRLKYKYRYIDRIEETADANTDALHFGSYIHKILEEGYEASTMAELDKLAQHHKENYKFGKSYNKKIEPSLKNFLRLNASLEETVAVEHGFNIDMGNDIEIIGYIDRIIKGKEGGFLIIDYKTGRREKSKTELYQDTQLKGYAFAVHQEFKVPFDKLVCAHYYPVTDNLVTIKYSESQVAAHMRNVMNDVWKIRKLKGGEFNPCENEFCNWCGYKNVCTIFNDPQEIQKRLNEAKAKS